MVKYSAEISTPSYIDLPAPICERSAGLALDIGSSLIKVAFVDNKTSIQDGESPIAKGMKRIRLRSYSRNDLEKVSTDLSAAELTSRDCAIHITGIGAKTRGKDVEEILNVKTKFLSQIDCDITALTHMLNDLSKEELSLPDHKESLAESQVLVDDMKTMMEAMNKHSDYALVLDANEKKADDDVTSGPKTTFPFVLVNIGSRAEAFKVSQNGEVEMIGSSGRAGASFMGVSHIAANTKSYEDAVNLAVLGREQDVSTFTSDIVSEDAEKDVYSEVLMTDTLVFMHGKAVDKDRDAFPKESRARSLVFQYATDLAQFIHGCTVLAGVPHAYLAGNFLNAEIIRGEITKNLFFFESLPISQEPVTYSHTYLKHGGYLGAVGALITES